MGQINLSFTLVWAGSSSSLDRPASSFALVRQTRVSLDLLGAKATRSESAVCVVPLLLRAKGHVYPSTLPS